MKDRIVKRLREIAFGFMILAGIAGCGDRSDEGARSRPNIILISIDTLRADHVGCYGYNRDTTPVIDELASRSVRFTEALAPTPWTLPSHVAMMTGRHPLDAGIADWQSRIADDAPTLAELLKKAGYDTAAFVDGMESGLIGGKRGFDRGFDEYNHAPFVSDPTFIYDMARTVDASLSWLRERKRDAPFFLFLHTKSVHTTPDYDRLHATGDSPYRKPRTYQGRYLPGGKERFSWREGEDKRGVRYLRWLNEEIARGRLKKEEFPDEKLEELIALYDAGIYYTDEQIGRLLKAIDAMQLSDDTLILLTADHGEAFLDHDLFLHKELYRPLLRVPLIYHDPRRNRAQVISHEVWLEDIVPTLLLAAGETPPEGLRGKPLPLEESDGSRRRHFSYYHFKEGDIYEALALRDWPWKLVCYRIGNAKDYVTELYDLGKDPDESHPVENEIERRRSMKTKLLQWYAARKKDGLDRIPMNEEDIEHLRALGYIK